MYCFRFQFLSQFLRQKGGVVYILFAMSALPFFLFLSYVIDVSTAAFYKTKLGYALDAAALEGVRYDIEDADTNAEKIFFANFKEPGATFSSSVAGDNASITVYATYPFSGFFQSFTGIDWSPGERVTINRKVGGLELATVFNLYGASSLSDIKSGIEGMMDYFFRNQTENNLSFSIIPCCSTSDASGLTNNAATITQEIESISDQSESEFSGVKTGLSTLTPSGVTGDVAAKNFLIPENVKILLYMTTNETISSKFLSECQSAKDLGVNIYVISYNVSDSSALADYDSCATLPSWHFQASSFSDFSEATERVMKAILPIRSLN